MTDHNKGHSRTVATTEADVPLQFGQQAWMKHQSKCLLPQRRPSGDWLSPQWVPFITWLLTWFTMTIHLITTSDHQNSQLQRRCNNHTAVSWNTMLCRGLVSRTRVPLAVYHTHICHQQINKVTNYLQSLKVLRINYPSDFSKRPYTKSLLLLFWHTV